MIQSQFDQTAREALAAKAVDTKARKDLSWQQIADPDGGERAVITLDGKYLPTKPF